MATQLYLFGWLDRVDCPGRSGSYVGGFWIPYSAAIKGDEDAYLRLISSSLLASGHVRRAEWLHIGAVAPQTPPVGASVSKVLSLYDMETPPDASAEMDSPADSPQADWRTGTNKAAQFVTDGLTASLPPATPLMGQITRARFTGKERAQATMTMFDGQPGTVEVSKHGPRKDAWRIDWLDMPGGDVNWTGAAWVRVLRECVQLNLFGALSST